MKSVFRVSLAVAVVALMAASAFAGLSDELAQFGKGPATFLMTKDEASQWKSINNDADAQAFIDLFWARRDPTPKTVRNEFREQFDQRVQYADQNFAQTRTKGSMTDRGKVLILLGAPTEPVVRRGAGPGAARDMSEQDVADRQQSQQLWIYDQKKTETKLGLPTVTFAFVDEGNRGEWRLERTRESGDYNSNLERVKASLITQPNITAAEVAQLKNPPKAQAPKAVAAAVPAALTTPALQTAVDDLKAGKATATKDAQLIHAEFVSPTGEYFVPVELLVGKAAGLAADAGDTVFGVVEDESGKLVSSFELPAKPFVSTGDFIVDHTLDLTTGKYNVVMGLAKAGQPVAIASKKIDVTTVAKDATGVSKLVLTNDVHELEKAEPVKAPFAFGKLKVVPKGTISAKDELWYFVEVFNPGIDTATNLPKMQVALELSGNKRKIPAPLMDATALPLSGAVGPGEYAVTGSIPLAELSKPLEPGEYTFKLKLVDTITKNTYNLEQTIKIGG